MLAAAWSSASFVISLDLPRLVGFSSSLEVGGDAEGEELLDQLSHSTFSGVSLESADFSCSSSSLSLFSEGVASDVDDFVIGTGVVVIEGLRRCLLMYARDLEE